ncbi:SAM-dependent methyltransferase [Puteibacter caeruleilacunae]|nr:SAM-dependent methyltransferase [Puteibacter caeruleilacunae]
MQGKIYLIPMTLGDTTIERVIPEDIKSIVRDIKVFIVENIRTTRRYLKKIDRDINIDELQFFELNKHTNPNDIASYLSPALKGSDIGIISEAGCPGVADPGADVVKIAHTKNLQVVPLVGPSSILLALMASGMNGQNFAFNGYIPVKKPERARKLKELEKRSAIENQTQIFIEAPYRNMQLMEDILASCSPSTRLCIACDLTLETEIAVTKTVAQWKGKLPQIHKRPAIFLIQK